MFELKRIDMERFHLAVNILFMFALLSLHLPIWFNGRYASLLAIIHTLVSYIVGVKSLDTLSVVFFLLPIYVIYYFAFKKVNCFFIKVLLLFILFLAILPFGSMLPPR